MLGILCFEDLDFAKFWGVLKSTAEISFGEMSGFLLPSTIYKLLYICKFLGNLY